MHKLISTATNNFFLAMLFISLFAVASCSSNQKKMQPSANASALITYEKERTRGNRIPLYSIEILDNGMARYTGKANVSLIGERLVPLKKSKYRAILDQFNAVDFQQFDAMYKGKLRDLPLTSITYKGHKVTYQEAVCPKDLQDLVVLVEGVTIGD